MTMRITNYVWLAQGKLPRQQRISPQSLQRKVNEGCSNAHVQVVSPANQLSSEAVTALIEVDFNYELEHDPHALFVIRSDSIDNNFLGTFLTGQIPFIELRAEDEPPRIILCELTRDDGDDLRTRFSEAIETGTIDIATTRKELVRKIIELTERINQQGNH